MSALSCADAEILIAARAIASSGEPRAALLIHLERCDACLRLVRELENPVVVDALAQACEGVEDLVDLTVVPRDHYTRGPEIGRGGMGRILRARDRRLGRSVAIKELLDERLRARFEREARLTARLQHPAIVSVHEAGRWPTGEPFYAMKYVAGNPLHEVIAERPRLPERLALLPSFITVAEAIAYAHSERVIHRDLKPHNILIGAFGETVVIDWGLAKDLAEPEPPDSGSPYRSESPAFTLGGAGTPAYMAPEQASGEAPDERVDVFALGATLHHLLAGRAPGQAALPRETPPELRTVIAKAMAPDRADRYRNAGELAAELKRFQTGQLVSAHRYSLRALAVRWLRRHRAMVALGAASLIAIAVVALFSIERVVRARTDAEHLSGELLVERGRQELLAGQPGRSLPFLRAALRLGVDTPVLRFLVAEATRRMGRLVGSFSARIEDPRVWEALLRSWAAFKVYSRANRDGELDVLASRDGMRMLVIARHGPRYGVRLIDLRSRETLDEWHENRGAARARAFAPDGRAYAVAGCAPADDRAVRDAIRDNPRQVSEILAARENECSRTLVVSMNGGRHAAVHDAVVEAAEFSADGNVLVSLAGGRAYVWDERGQAREVWTLPDPIRAVASSSDGKRLAAATDHALYVREGGTERLLSADLARCSPATRPKGRNLRSLTFHATGERIIGATTTDICAWDARTGALLQHVSPELRPREVQTTMNLELSPDGAWLVAFSRFMDAQLFRADTLAPGPPLSVHKGTAWAAFGPGVIATSGRDGIARIHDLRGQELARFESSDSPIQRLWLTADSTRLVTVRVDGTVELWDASRRLSGPIGPAVREASWMGDGRLLTVSNQPSSVQVWSDRGLEAVLPERVDLARPSADGRSVSVAENDRLLGWDPITGAVETRVALANVRRFVTSRGERWIAMWRDEPWKIYAADGRLVATLPDAGNVNGPVRLSSDDARLAAVVGSGLRVWDTSTGALLYAREAGPSYDVPRPQAFSPDGKLLAWVADERLHISDDRGNELGSFPNAGAAAPIFSPDATRILTRDPGGVATLSTVRGELVARYEVPGTLTSAAFSSDGQLLALGDDSGVVRVWIGSLLVQETKLAGPIRVLLFDPDGKELFAADEGAGWRWSTAVDDRDIGELDTFLADRVSYALERGTLMVKPRFTARPAPVGSVVPASRGPSAVITCPAGAGQMGAPFPAGRAVWCSRPDGTVIGPVRFWSAAGALVVDAHEPARDGASDLAEQLVQQSKTAARQSKWLDALQLSEEALRLQPDNVDALTVAIMSSCNLADRGRAAGHLNRLKDDDRKRQLKQICSSRGVEPE